ncbi:hypothetical protein Y032_0651g1141 [Ancylostoma ceylanicum]|uniref:Uncharacterized protein n=1 Tax=Ancylostoma ceylanicum TaxID=53326 RepID=A0A016WIW0_9BILA|nr:hypothetical protein Y032_0651g1141 [Ancylostoma ceylanicum]
MESQRAGEKPSKRPRFTGMEDDRRAVCLRSLQGWHLSVVVHLLQGCVFAYSKHVPEQNAMGDPKDAPFFNLPPLPAQPTGGMGSAEKLRDGSKETIEKNVSKDKLSKEAKIGSREPALPPHVTPAKPAPNLGTFKLLIALTWLLFTACVAGLVYVIIQYKIDRDGLKSSSATTM